MDAGDRRFLEAQIADARGWERKPADDIFPWDYWLIPASDRQRFEFVGKLNSWRIIDMYVEFTTHPRWWWVLTDEMKPRISYVPEKGWVVAVTADGNSWHREQDEEIGVATARAWLWWNREKRGE